MKSNKNKDLRAFVDAARMKGVLKHYDLGGGVAGTSSPTLMAQPTTTSAQGTSALTPGTGNSVFSPGQALYNPVGFTNEVGGVGQGLASSFTAQNQYQAQLAPTQQLNYNNVVGTAAGNALSGYGQAQGNIAQGQALESQLMAEGQGQGPNPAQAQLAQNTGTNVANQAALMAGQRGAGANAGLMARQAAQQGAATQQNAVGQAATLQAQQELAAQQGAAALQGQIGNQITNEQGQNQALFGTAAGATNTQNANLISNYGQAQGINAQAAQQNANATNQTLGGIFSGASSLAALLAGGGEVKDPAQAISDGFNNATALGAQPPQPKPQPSPAPQNYASGGEVSWVANFLNGSPAQQASMMSGNVGSVAQANVPTLQEADNQAGNAKTMKNAAKSYVASQQTPAQQQPQQGTAQTVSGVSDTPGAQATTGEAYTDPNIQWSAKGGKVGKPHKAVPAMLSPDEKYFPPKQAKEVASGKKDPMSVGKDVKGKAKVPGDSLKNDTVPAKLEEGGVVVKRSVMASHDPEKIRSFVQAVIGKSGMKRKSA